MRDRQTDNRVVITGLGLVSPLGVGYDANWRAVLEGRSGAGPITLVDPDEAPVQAACEALEFEVEDFLSRRSASRMDRFAHLAVAAARLGLDDARLSVNGGGDRVGVVVGTALGGLGSHQDQLEIAWTRGTDRVSPFALPMLLPNMAAAQVAIEVGLRGPLSCTSTACAAGVQAIGDASEVIRRGSADAMVAGAADAGITPMGLAAFAAAGALSSRGDDPAGAARPFDASRDGFLLGEAGAVVVLERLDLARARGVPIYCEVLGFGSSAGPDNLINPDPTGSAGGAAVSRALADAGLSAEQVDYVNAHGAATQGGDVSEIAALRRALGDDVATSVAVSSTKPQHGHCLGASSSLEAAITALALREGTIPATANLSEIDPDCDAMDHVYGGVRDADLDVAVTACFGVGGNNAALVLAAV